MSDCDKYISNIRESLHQNLVTLKKHDTILLECVECINTTIGATVIGGSIIPIVGSMFGAYTGLSSCSSNVQRLITLRNEIKNLEALIKLDSMTEKCTYDVFGRPNGLRVISSTDERQSKCDNKNKKI